jgi:hypothetical protein
MEGLSEGCWDRAPTLGLIPNTRPNERKYSTLTNYIGPHIFIVPINPKGILT